MNLIADILLLAGTVAAAIYCYVLAARVKVLTSLDSGVGGAITALSRQVEEMRSSVNMAKRASGSSVKEMATMTARAEIAAGRLELLLATLHEGDGAQAKRPVRKPRKATKG